MDTLTPADFNALFERVCVYVDMKGAYSREEIDERMDKARKIMKSLSGKTKKERTKRRYKGYSKQMRKLVSHGFADRTLDEAMAHPRGKVALTLQHGLKKAKEILLRRKKKEKQENKRSLRGIHWH